MEPPLVIAMNFAVCLTVVFIIHQLTSRRDQQKASESPPMIGRLADRIEAGRQRVLERQDQTREAQIQKVMGAQLIPARNLDDIDAKVRLAVTTGATEGDHR